MQLAQGIHAHCGTFVADPDSATAHCRKLMCQQGRSNLVDIARGVTRCCSLTSQSFLSSRILSSALRKAWTANCHCGCCDPGCCGICKSHGCPAYGSPLASSDSSIFPFMCEVGLEQLLVRSFHMSLPSGAEARTSPKRRKGCWWTRQTLPPVRIAQETTRREGESSW